jgi:hypothetical protein
MGSELSSDNALTSIQTADQQTDSAIGNIIDAFVFHDRFMQCPKEVETSIDAKATPPPKASTPPVSTLCYKILQAEEPGGNSIPNQ